MFGIGLPEMIVILAIALIVVGPDKLPDLARSAAKWMLELKKMAETLKKDLTEDGTLDAIKSDLHNAALGHKNNLLESSDQSWKTLTPGEGVNPAPDKTGDKIIEAEITVVDAHKPAPPIDDHTGDKISEDKITVVDAPKPAPPIDDQSRDKISETPAHKSPEKDTNTHPAC